MKIKDGKRIGVMVCMFAIIIGMIPVNAAASSGYVSGNDTYSVETLAKKNKTKEVRASVKKKTLTLHSVAGDRMNTHVIKKMKSGQMVKVLKKSARWYYVQCGSLKGYCLRSGLKIQKTNYEDIIAYGKKFLGNPYVWGGTSLKHGCDCSGYTQGVYKHFHYKLPRTSYYQRSAGIKVHCLKEAQPGDLICYYGHVAIYLGNDRIMHAKGRKYGIVITKGVKYRKIASIRRII